MTDQLRVLVADDQADVRYALRTLLELAPGLGVTVVGEVADGGSLLAAIEAHQPDVLLLDWKLPGLRSIAYLRSLYPRLRIIVLSLRAESRQVALDAGADAFVYKGDPAEQLVAAVQQVRDLYGRTPCA
ncbi:MAG: response regulator transcription factor [Chloroflexi bacterium]|nr:response regulator transcription factor [Chloroflexota bacterium]